MKRTATLVKNSEAVEIDRQAFETKIKELFSFSPRIMQTAAITALETLQDAWKQSCITFYAGRRSDYLARAVERHPEFFNVDKEPPHLDDLLAVFALAQLSVAKDYKLFTWWQENYTSVSPWDIIDEIKVRKGRMKRSNPNAIVFPEAEVKFSSNQGNLTVQPTGKKTVPLIGLSNGKYKVELERRKEKKEKKQ